MSDYWGDELVADEMFSQGVLDAREGREPQDDGYWYLLGYESS